MNKKKIIELESEKRNLVLLKAIILDKLLCDKNNIELLFDLGKKTFEIYILERKINHLTENIIQS